MPSLNIINDANSVSRLRRKVFEGECPYCGGLNIDWTSDIDAEYLTYTGYCHDCHKGNFYNSYALVYEEAWVNLVRKTGNKIPNWQNELVDEYNYDCIHYRQEYDGEPDSDLDELASKGWQIDY